MQYFHQEGGGAYAGYALCWIRHWIPAPVYIVIYDQLMTTARNEIHVLSDYCWYWSSHQVAPLYVTLTNLDLIRVRSFWIQPAITGHILIRPTYNPLPIISVFYIAFVSFIFCILWVYLFYIILILLCSTVAVFTPFSLYNTFNKQEYFTFFTVSSVEITPRHCQIIYPWSCSWRVHLPAAHGTCSFVCHSISQGSIYTAVQTFRCQELIVDIAIPVLYRHTRYLFTPG